MLAGLNFAVDLVSEHNSFNNNQRKLNPTRMKKIASLILALGLSLAAFAQNATISGVVRDEARQPIIGAFVV